MTWKVEHRKYCKQCDDVITHNRFRSFCSTVCRQKYHNKIAYHKYNRNEEQRLKSGAKKIGKIRCLICGSWYWKVGAHVTQRHNITAREYRELHRLEVKKGTTPNHLRKIWGKNALDNNMDKQLIRVGKKTRFKKGQYGLGVYERSPVTIAKMRIRSNNLKNDLFKSFLRQVKKSLRYKHHIKLIN